MTIALIGNNDGPGRLQHALRDSDHGVIFVGYQKEYSGAASPNPGRVALVPDETTALNLLAPLEPDLVVNCFANFRYRRLHHRYPTLNVHLAPLPAYRGRHPLQWALINGEREFGATIHDINDDYDAGTIRWQKFLPVRDGWSAVELREALMQLVEADFARFIEEYDPAAPGLPNDPAHATYVTRRYPADGALHDWSDRERVYRQINALRDDEHPAYLLREDGKYPCTSARRGRRAFVGAVATTVVDRRDGALEVVCGDGRTLWLRLPGLDLRINDKLKPQ